jgi:hypothetical protein
MLLNSPVNAVKAIHYQGGAVKLAGDLKAVKTELQGLGADSASRIRNKLKKQPAVSQ